METRETREKGATREGSHERRETRRQGRHERREIREKGATSERPFGRAVDDRDRRPLAWRRRAAFKRRATSRRRAGPQVLTAAALRGGGASSRDGLRRAVGPPGNPNRRFAAETRRSPPSRERSTAGECGRGGPPSGRPEPNRTAAPLRRRDGHRRRPRLDDRRKRGVTDLVDPFLIRIIIIRAGVGV